MSLRAYDWSGQPLHRCRQVLSAPPDPLDKLNLSPPLAQESCSAPSVLRAAILHDICFTRACSDAAEGRANEWMGAVEVLGAVEGPDVVAAAMRKTEGPTVVAVAR